MPTKVIMPTLGLTMEQGTINKWLKREGEAVSKDEPILVVETDKAAMEVGAPASGILKKIVVPEGETVPVTALIAWITEPGEELPEEAGAAPAAPRQAAPAPSPAPAATPAPAPAAAPPGPAGEIRASPAARRVARELNIDLATVQGTGPEGRIVEEDVRRAAEQRAAAQAVAAAPAAEERIKASPVARRLAQELGVDLAGITGTGPGGRIVEEDVRRAAEAQKAAAAAAPAPAAPIAVTGELVPLNRIRRVTAQRMAESARTVARVTEVMEIDMTEAVRFRTQLQAEFEKRYNTRLPWDAILAKACAIALREHPTVNAQWAETGIRLMPDINIGIAVAIPEGLMVPVLKQVDRKSLVELARELLTLADKARAGKLGIDEITGGTFTITNLGGYGIETFTPIVNPPEAAILGVGRIARRPAVVNDQIVPRDLMYVALSFDHRVLDGAPAAAFLQRLKEVLEAPYSLLA